MTGGTTKLTRVRVGDLIPGDRFDFTDATVTGVEWGLNRQVFVHTVTDGGAPVTREFDMAQWASVWR